MCSALKRTGESKHDLRTTLTGGDGNVYSQPFHKPEFYNKIFGFLELRTAIIGNSYCTPLVMKEWLHAVAGLDPFCVGEPFSDSARSATLPAGSIVWLQCAHGSSGEGNTTLKDESTRNSATTQHQSASVQQPASVRVRGGGRGRQASQSASILRSVCVSTQRGARCVCGAVAG